MLFAFRHFPEVIFCDLRIRLNGVDLMDNKERKDALENMDEFNQMYNHYLSDDEETQIVPVPHFEKDEQIEDISSYSEAAQ